MTTELIVKTLENQGYKLTELPELGYSFMCEDLNIVLILYEDYPEKFHLVLPQIYECTDIDRQEILELMNQINGEYMFVKLVMRGNDVWAFTDLYIDQTNNLDEILEKFIRSLIGAHINFYTEAIKQGLVDYDDETEKEATQLLLS